MHNGPARAGPVARAAGRRAGNLTQRRTGHEFGVSSLRDAELFRVVNPIASIPIR